MAFFDDILQRLSIIRELGDRLAEVPAITRPVVGSHGQMMGSDGASHGIAQLLDRLDGLARRRMFQDDLELWEALVELDQMRQEGILRVKHSYVVGSV